MQQRTGDLLSMWIGAPPQFPAAGAGWRSHCACGTSISEAQ
jgi:hypothetical protein